MSDLVQSHVFIDKEYSDTFGTSDAESRRYLEFIDYQRAAGIEVETVNEDEYFLWSLINCGYKVSAGSDGMTILDLLTDETLEEAY